MSSQNKNSAEGRFTEAFERLKAGKPTLLPVGSKVSQNNIAKEAGLDPSALKKSRFPSLIQKIQEYIKAAAEADGPSGRQLKAQAKSERLTADRDRKVLRAERDDAQSQLLSAQRAVLELLQENSDLRTRLAKFSGEVKEFPPT
ncbi:hypothetical protein JKG41_14565 [Acidithiobacillus sp. MC2.1]|uniref:hypothetical protein n=1 Tax=Pseudomonadota TaxID=1224 RepID=UPI0013038125|nr:MULTISPECIES: hypothetical protein [Pseudomonadota]MBN6746257.1 hypothetical protein [Acidithiobacillus sp. MC2.2]MDG0856198.1 hypothetical protein [Roseateles puraquae]